MTCPGKIEIRCPAALGERQLQGLTDLLTDCVEGGASVGFMLPMTRAKAEAFWRSVSAGMVRGQRATLLAEDSAGAIAGTVQLIWAQFENQPHRAEIAKMLVHRRARRRGIGAALLRAAEQHALRAGRTLLVLDTASEEAERLYLRQGWQRVGVIPGYALWPEGGRCSTTIFFKDLRGASGSPRLA